MRVTIPSPAPVASSSALNLRVPARRQRLQPSPLTPRPGSQRLPTELWWRILRLATQVPGLNSPQLSEFEPPPAEPLSVRRTKRALVQVCSLWRELATPFLYEYLAPENPTQVRGLFKLLSQKPSLGKFTKRIAFAVHAPYNDVQASLLLVTHILLLAPNAEAVHFVFLSGIIPSGAPKFLKGPRGHFWGWTALHWTDTTANDPRRLERMLKHCPVLEQLRFIGAAVADAPRATTSLRLAKLRLLSIRDADKPALEMVSGWSMPQLTHLSLSLVRQSESDLSRLTLGLLQRYGAGLKSLRIDGGGLDSGTMTSYLALCPALEELICPAGTQLPPGTVHARLSKVGLLRAASPWGSAVLAAHIAHLDQLPALRTVAALEDARFVFTARDVRSIFGSRHPTIAFTNSSGDPIRLPSTILV